MKKLSLLFALSAGFAFAGENLILNGTFEGTATQAGWGGYANSTGFSCPNWVFDPAGRAGLGRPDGTWIASGLPVGEFGLFLQSTGDAAAVYQTIPSVPADWYRVSIKYTGRPGHLPSDSYLYLGDIEVGKVTPDAATLFDFRRDLYFEGGENVVFKILSPNVGNSDLSNCFEDAQLRRLDAVIDETRYLDFAEAMANAVADDEIVYTTAGDDAVFTTGTYTWSVCMPKVVVPGTCVVNGVVAVNALSHAVGTFTILEANAFDIAEGASFVLDSALADHCSLAIVGNQLQLTVNRVEPDWAEWDVGNECWKYFFSDGEPFTEEWEDGITDRIEVRFSSIEEFNAIKVQNVTPSRFLLTKLELPVGSSLYDFSGGFNFDITPNTVIDLKGNRLKLPAANIGGNTAFTVTDPGEDSVIANGSFENFNGTVGNGGAWNYTSGGFSFKDWISPASGGITKGKTTWVGAAVPNGTYACYMQGSSEMKQVFTAAYEGLYTLNFYYISRQHCPAGNLSVSVDGEELWGVTGISAVTSFLSQSLSFTLAAGSHELRFNTWALGGDTSTIVDNVTLRRAGYLLFEVPEGTSITNNNVAITGMARVVKQGAGEFLANRPQTYTGGTEIPEGQVTIANKTSLGPSGEIKIGADAVFELNGTIDTYNYRFLLEGGTIQNTGDDITSNFAQISYLRLTADSTYKPTGSSGFIGLGYSATTLDLGGHTLTVPIGEGKDFWFYNTKVTAGTIELSGGGRLQVDKTAVSAPDTYFRVNCALNVAVPFTVGGYEAIYGVDDNAGTAVMTVMQTFKPKSAFYRGVTMANGATLDLSAFGGILGRESTFTGAKTAMVYPTGTDAASAKCFVELHGRSLATAKIVDWAAVPEFLEVLPSEQTKRDGRKFYLLGDGVYVTGGTIFFVR